MSRIEEVLKSSPTGPVHLVPFIAGGHGGMETTVAALQGVAAGGASVVELGVPFSDPIADGPAIQAAYHEALEGGATTAGVLATLE
ncbi:MAG: tryptophan synthase subunit alpha, partial [Planctomycetota bacterium]